MLRHPKPTRTSRTGPRLAVRFPRFAGVLAVVALSLGGTFCARSVPATPNLPMSERDLSSMRVTIKGRDIEVREVLRSFATQIGARLILDTAIKGTLSIETKDSKLTDVMNDLCVAFECQWSLSQSEPPDLVVRSSSSSSSD